MEDLVILTACTVGAVIALGTAAVMGRDKALAWIEAKLLTARSKRDEFIRATTHDARRTTHDATSPQPVAPLAPPDRKTATRS